MLVEIHMIQNHSPANINRDDLGAPKTAIFGGFARARISSQCLKRSIRKSPLFDTDLHSYISTRTKAFPKLVAAQLPNSGIPEEEWERILAACARIGKGVEDQARTRKSQKEDDPLLTPQLILLAPQEVEGFVAALKRLREAEGFKEDYHLFLGLPKGKQGDEAAAQKKRKKDTPSEKFFHELRQAYAHHAVDISLFGRMTTGDAFQDVEASMQVAHAISTHEVSLEVDYFTAVDERPDLRVEAGHGAGHVDGAQLCSATFYKYFSLHWKGLVDNLLRDLKNATDQDRAAARQLAAKTLGAFLHAAAKTVPSGKRNSHAHNNLPDCVLVEVKKLAVPTNYANAFVDPVRSQNDIVSESINMLGQYVREVAEGYGIPTTRLWFACRSKDHKADFGQAERKAKFHELVQATVAAVSNGRG